MKIALFGGTFDPIHNGHINAALEVLRLGLVQEVWFVPVCWHRFKSNIKISPIEHRLKMIELAIQGREGLKAVDLNENPTTTIETIEKAKSQFPKNQFFWLMGTNLIEEFPSWKDPEKVLQEVKLILYPVPGSEQEPSQLLDESNSIRPQAEEIDLSSTAVRQKLLKGENVSDLLDAKVIDYISKNNLYS